MAYADKLFKEEVTKLLNEGFSDGGYEVRPVWPDGQKAHTIKIFGAVRRYDLSKEFPALTLRKQAFKTVVRELLWIWQKKSNNVDELGKAAGIWRSWQRPDDHSIGRSYGFQLGIKYKYPQGEMDQVDNLIYLLKNKPMDRRMIVTMWNNADLWDMQLPPCCYETIWDVSNGKLNCILMQRSADLLSAGCAGGFDSMEYAILVHMLAQVCGYQVGELIHVVNNLHIYDRHIEVVKKVLQNPEYSAPTLWINPEVKDFYAFTEDDFRLDNYQATKLEEKFEVAE